MHPLFRDTVVTRNQRPFDSPVQSDFDHTLSEQSFQPLRPRSGAQVRLKGISPQGRPRSSDRHATFPNQPVAGAYSDDYEETKIGEEEHNPQTVLYKGRAGLRGPPSSPPSAQVDGGYQPPRRGSSIRQNVTTIDQVNADFLRRKSADRISFGERSPPPLRHQPPSYALAQPAPMRPRSDGPAYSQLQHNSGPNRLFSHPSSTMHRGNYNGPGSREQEVTSPAPNGMNRQKTPASPDGRHNRESSTGLREDYDFPEEALQSMSFRTLKDQSFDCDPTRPAVELPEAVASSGLGEKLDHVRCLRSNGHATDIGSQTKFFESLSINEWEEAGDWIIEKLGENLKNLQKHRREMREETKKYEDEVEKRFTLIADTQETVKGVLDGMRKHKLEILNTGEHRG